MSAKRECGPCTACCTVFGIEELQKPSHQPCAHLCSAGCQIYAERPTSCATFKCYWLRGGLSDSDRPDLSGVVLSANKMTDEPALAAFLMRPLSAAEFEALRPKARQMMRLFGMPKVFYIPHDLPIPTRYDLIEARAGRGKNSQAKLVRRGPVRLTFLCDVIGDRENWVKQIHTAQLGGS